MKTKSNLDVKTLERITRILGNPIPSNQAITQFQNFRTALRNGTLTENNMPLAICFTAREIRNFLEVARMLDFETDNLPEENRGIAFVFGLSTAPGHRNGKGTVMLVSTNFIKDLATGREGAVLQIDNQIFGHLQSPDTNISPATSTRASTQSYDIGHTYP